MALAFKGTGSASTTFSTTANQASFILTTVTTIGAVGDLAVMTYAVDNNATGDGDEGSVSGVVDSAGNTGWTKAIEFTNGQGSAQAGTCVGIWYCNLTAQLSVGATITSTFTNAASRDASAFNLTYFTMAAGSTAAVEGTPASLANDGVAAGSLDCTTASISCIRIRATSSESSSVTAWTKTAAFTAVLTQAVSNFGSTLVNQGIRGEYLISTATGQASAPTGGAGAVDNASVYVAFKEVSAATIVVSMWYQRLVEIINPRDEVIGY